MSDRFLLILALGVLTANAQGTRADYERAADLRDLTANKVFRDRVRPHWLPGGTQFWYQVKTGTNAHEFVFVDALAGERRPAFDHGRLAAALKAVGVKEAHPSRLPLEQLEWLPGEPAARFRADRKTWRCDLRDYSLRADTNAPSETLAALLPSDAPQASTRTGEETSLAFVNRTEKEVELFWLDAEGERRSYGKLGPGGQRDQHTFAGHVWQAADTEGKVIAVFQAAERALTAEITDSPEQRSATPPQTRSSRRNRRESPRDTSPDGHWRALIKQSNVLLRNSDTGAEIALTDDGREENAYTDRFYWSPDSRHLVVMRTWKGDERKVYLIESSPKDQLQPKLHSFAYDKPGDRISVDKPRLFEVATQKSIPIPEDLFPNPWSISELRWAPDSSHFTFLYNQRGHQILRVLAVEAASGAVRTIVEERSPTFINYSGNFFLQHLEVTDEVLWMSERDGWNHLYLYDARSGRVKNQLTRGEWVVRHVERVDVEKRQIWFRAGGIHSSQDPYQLHYARVNFDGSDLIVMTEGDGSHSVQFSPDNRFLIDTYSRVDLAPVNELRAAEDGRLICGLEQGDMTALLAAGWRPPERFAAKGRDGVTDIYGVIHRPLHFDPAKKYPVIEQIYAGPQGAFVPKRFGPASQMQELAELGFIVVQIDGMGTAYRSKAFHDVCWQNLGDAGFPDRILWLRAAAAKYPALDVTRVGIYGGSAGGQNALRAVLAHGDFYKAAAADCGCHDNRMDKIWWNEQWMGWPVGPHYEEQSNVTQAHQLQGKLLLMVGELDRNVDPASTMQVVNALIKADKDFELIVFPGAGHGAGGSAYGRRRMADFFVRSLLGVEPRG